MQRTALRDAAEPPGRYGDMRVVAMPVPSLLVALGAAAAALGEVCFVRAENTGAMNLHAVRLLANHGRRTRQVAMVRGGDSSCVELRPRTLVAQSSFCPPARAFGVGSERMPLDQTRRAGEQRQRSKRLGISPSARVHLRLWLEPRMISWRPHNHHLQRTALRSSHRPR
jgi:hypothetical protein